MRKRYRYSAYHIETQRTQAALQVRATEKTQQLNHDLVGWYAAKRKKHGPDAMQAACSRCGAMVVIMPRYWHSLQYQQVPAMKGNALFEVCYLEGALR